MPINLEMIGKKIEIAPFVCDQDDVIHGFDRPILHGLCACGFVIRGVLQKFCGGNPNRFKAFTCRFSKPCYPGDLLQSRGWRTAANALLMQTGTPDGRVVLDNFVVKLADQPLP